MDITEDTRDGRTRTKHVPGLRQGLDPAEDPVLGMFLRFFPVSFFVAALPRVGEHYAASRGQHMVTWNKGTLLRFIGMLVHMAAYPLPNIKWHWVWPKHLPAHSAPVFPAAQYMSRTTFERYWQYCAIPGYLGADIAGEPSE